MRYLLSLFVLLIAISSHAQNVGIGTNTPLDKLTVQSIPNSYGITHTDGTIKLSTFVGGSTGGGWLGTQSNHPLSFYTNNSSSNMIILQNGKVGIGTSTPSFRLDVKSYEIESNNNTHLLNLSGRNPVLLFTDELSAGYGYIKSWTNGFNPGYSEGMEMGAPPGQSLFFSTNYGPTMVIANSNNVGIGGAATDYKLALNSTVVQGNNNTNMLSLKGRNPVLAFINEDNTAYGYLKVWNNAPFAPYTNGLVIGASPGYPIFFSTNNYGVTMTIADNGNVGIGTTLPTYKLSVNGNIRSKEVVVEIGWADYVFDHNYPLKTLDEVEQFIKRNNHLPNIPSAKEVEENGLHLGDVQKRMMEKIEELTLYMIELKKEIEILKKKN